MSIIVNHSESLQNNRDLNQGVLHIYLFQIWWSWFEWATTYRADKLRIDAWTDTQTDAGNDNTRRPKLASDKNTTKAGIYRPLVWGTTAVCGIYRWIPRTKGQYFMENILMPWRQQ